MRKFTTILAVGLLLPLGCKKAEFQEFSPPGGRFTVMMQGSPTREERDEKGLHVTMYMVGNRNEAYTVGYIDIPPGKAHDLDEAVRGMAEKAGGTNIRSTGSEQIVNGSMLGWREFEMDITKPKTGFAAGRVLFARARLYMVLSIGTENRLTNPDVRNFIDSFRLTDGDTPSPATVPEGAAAIPQPKQPVTGEIPVNPPIIPFPEFKKPPATNPKPPVISTKPPLTQPLPSFPQPKKPQALGGTFDPEFTENAPDGGLLVGFEVGLGKFVKNDIIATLRPIFRVKGMDTDGELHGTDTTRLTKYVAKPGYAVGAISIKHGLGVDGFALTFMKVVNDKLDPSDSYKSDWIGGMGGGGPITQGGDGKLVTGIVGKQGKKNCSGIGLIFKADP